MARKLSTSMTELKVSAFRHQSRRESVVRLLRAAHVKCARLCNLATIGALSGALSVQKEADGCMQYRHAMMSNLCLIILTPLQL